MCTPLRPLDHLVGQVSDSVSGGHFKFPSGISTALSHDEVRVIFLRDQFETIQKPLDFVLQKKLSVAEGSASNKSWDGYLHLHFGSASSLESRSSIRRSFVLGQSSKHRDRSRLTLSPVAQTQKKEFWN